MTAPFPAPGLRRGAGERQATVIVPAFQAEATLAVARERLADMRRRQAELRGAIAELSARIAEAEAECLAATSGRREPEETA